MDLSKVPELELRRKIKPINDRLNAIEAEIEHLEETEEAKMQAALKPIRDRLNAVRDELQNARDAAFEKMGATYKHLQDERDELETQIAQLLGEDRAVEGICHLTGLPIFSDDETTGFTALACVAEPEKAVA